MFEESTSRELDPQKHTYRVVMNMSKVGYKWMSATKQPLDEAPPAPRARPQRGGASGCFERGSEARPGGVQGGGGEGRSSGRPRAKHLAGRPPGQAAEPEAAATEAASGSPWACRFCART